MAEPRIDIAQLERNIKDRDAKVKGFLIDQGWAVRAHTLANGTTIIQWSIPLGELTLSDHRQPAQAGEEPLGLHLTNTLWVGETLVCAAAWAHIAAEEQWLIDRYFDARLNGHLWTAWEELSLSW